MLPAIVTGLFSLGQQFFKNKAEEKQAIHERKITTIKQDGNWDEIQARNSNNSWKDEYLTIVFSLPFPVIFIDVLFNGKEAAEKYEVAFKVLKDTVPAEYWYLLGIMFAASFGVKKVTDYLASKKG